jgi:predicted transcriptional regulator
MTTKQTEKNFQEIWSLFKETDRRFKETYKRFKETDKEVKETSRIAKETIKAVNSLTEKWSKFVEGLIAPAVGIHIGR